MTTETTYREGTDPLSHEQEQKMNEKGTEQLDENIESVMNPTDEIESQSPDEPSVSETKEAPSPLKNVETAVLLVVNEHGNVLPVVNIESLDMKRIATPREVYRICLDAADQLSSVALLGEMTNIFATLQKESSKFTATQMANLLIQAQQNKVKGDE